MAPPPLLPPPPPLYFLLLFRPPSLLPASPFWFRGSGAALSPSCGRGGAEAARLQPRPRPRRAAPRRRPAAACEPGGAGMLWLLCGPSSAMESQVLVIRIKIPDGGAVDWTVHSAPQLLFRDVLVSAAKWGGRGGSSGGSVLGGSNGEITPWVLGRVSRRWVLGEVMLPRRGARSQKAVLQSSAQLKAPVVSQGNPPRVWSCPTHSIPLLARHEVVMRCCLGSTGKVVMWKSASARVWELCAPHMVLWVCCISWP